MMKVYRQWTKDEIKQVISLWESCTVKEMCEKLNAKEFQIMYIASMLRKCGYHLPRKKTGGNLMALVKEVVEEIK